jgi:hypothetical protein
MLYIYILYIIYIHTLGTHERAHENVGRWVTPTSDQLFFGNFNGSVEHGGGYDQLIPTCSCTGLQEGIQLGKVRFLGPITTDRLGPGCCFNCLKESTVQALFSQTKKCLKNPWRQGPQRKRSNISKWTSQFNLWARQSASWLEDVYQRFKLSASTWLKGFQKPIDSPSTSFKHVIIHVLGSWPSKPFWTQLAGNLQMEHF